MNFIKGLFKKEKENTFFNVSHPDFVLKVEPAFKTKEVQYYRFKQEYVMPYGRYQFVQAFMLQHELRMSEKILSGFLDEQEKYLSGERGEIRPMKAWEVIQKIRARMALAFDPERAYDYASVVYFDDKEVLYGYDMAYNKKKIALWREAGALDFFYTRPGSEFFGLSNFSEQDLTNFIQTSSEILKDLTSDIT